MARRTRTVVWSALAAAGAALAIGSVVAWQVSQPATSAGESLESLRGEAAVTSPASAAAVASSTAPAGQDPAAPSGASAATSPAASGEAAATTVAVKPPAARDADPTAVGAAAVAAPVRVVVDSLGIDARVDPVGVRDDGSMTIPKSPSTVGWYEFGPAPGDPTGNTVLAGHVDTAAEGPGALYDLREVEVGTRIVVEDAAGVSHEYEVAGKQSIVKAALPVAEIFARDGRPLLVIITCGGEFQPALRSYRDNLVVTAVPVTAAPAAGAGGVS